MAVLIECVLRALVGTADDILHLKRLPAAVLRTGSCTENVFLRLSLCSAGQDVLHVQNILRGLLPGSCLGRADLLCKEILISRMLCLSGFLAEYVVHGLAYAAVLIECILLPLACATDDILHLKRLSAARFRTGSCAKNVFLRLRLCLSAKVCAKQVFLCLSLCSAGQDVLHVQDILRGLLPGSCLGCANLLREEILISRGLFLSGFLAEYVVQGLAYAAVLIECILLPLLFRSAGQDVLHVQDILRGLLPGSCLGRANLLCKEILISRGLFLSGFLAEYVVQGLAYAAVLIECILLPLGNFLPAFAPALNDILHLKRLFFARNRFSEQILPALALLVRTEQVLLSLSLSICLLCIRQTDFFCKEFIHAGRLFLYYFLTEYIIESLLYAALLFEYALFTLGRGTGKFLLTLTLSENSSDSVVNTIRIGILKSADTAYDAVAVKIYTCRILRRGHS